MEDKNRNVIPTVENDVENQSLKIDENPQLLETNEEYERQLESTSSEQSILESTMVPESEQPTSETKTSTPQSEPSNVTPQIDEQIVVDQKITDADQVIAEIAPEKEVKPTLVIILFAVLLSFAFILPFVNDYITEYLNSKKVISSPTPSTQNPSGGNQQDDDENEVLKVDLNDETVLKINNISISKFTFTTEGEENYLTYEITKDEAQSSIRDNLYLELYSAENMLITRAKIYLGNASISNQSFTIKSYIPENAVTTSNKIAVVEKNENDFPHIELEIGVDGKQRLTCVRNTHEIEYTFQDYFLNHISEKFVGIKGTDVDAYTELLAEYQNKNVDLKAHGISSELVASDTGFTITNVIDLSQVNVSTLDEFAYFEAASIARKVNFEMESMGYTCS